MNTTKLLLFGALVVGSTQAMDDAKNKPFLWRNPFSKLSWSQRHLPIQLPKISEKIRDFLKPVHEFRAEPVDKTREWFNERVLRPWLEQKIIEGIYNGPIYLNSAVTDDYAGLPDLPIAPEIQVTERYSSKALSTPTGATRIYGGDAVPYEMPSFLRIYTTSKVQQTFYDMPDVATKWKNYKAKEIEWHVKVGPHSGYQIQPFLLINYDRTHIVKPMGEKRSLYPYELEHVRSGQHHFCQPGFPSTWQSHGQKTSDE